MALNERIKDEERADVLIVVNRKGDALLVEYPESMEDALDGIYLDDNCFEGHPKEPGYYRLNVQFWHTHYPSSPEGPAEDEWGFNVVAVKRMRMVPDE